MAFQPKPFGKYYLLEPIATGGMAEIFKAKTIAEVAGFEKLLAIKRILPHLSQNTDFITMLIDEAKIAVQLNHMNIVQVFDLGKVDDDYFIAMEYIHGRDLRSIMRRCEELKIRMSVENAVYIILEVCKGLDYAHRKKDQFGRPVGIVHRDVSPQNVLISYEGLVKIVDFGIAKAARKATETEAGVLKGKFAYMSPEQARGLEVDQRTDVFSAGIILYELLKGERLFYTDNNMKTLDLIRNFHLEPPFLPPDVPSELEYILLQALSNDPNERYESANDFQVDLTKFLYSSALDFTSKNLAELMGQLFKEEVNSQSGREPDDEAVDLDTQTRMMIAQADQEVLVSRPEEKTPSQARQGGGRGKQAAKGRIPSPAELFEEPRGKKSRASLGVWLVLLLVVFFAWKFRDSALKFVKNLQQHTPNTVTQATPPPIVPVAQSSLHVETKPPGARVTLDKVEQEELTPVLIKDVIPRQAHDLVVSLPGFATVMRTVRTEPGEIQQIKIEMSQETASLFIGSDPTEAEIFLNDQAAGKTPRELSDVPANVDIAVKLRKAGFQDHFEVVRLSPKQTKILQVRLGSQAGAFGTLTVTSVPPGARIFLDGVERREKTPATIVKLDATRSHQIAVKLDGYKEYSESFRVVEGATHSVNAYLKTQPEEIR